MPYKYYNIEVADRRANLAVEPILRDLQIPYDCDSNGVRYKYKLWLSGYTVSRIKDLLNEYENLNITSYNSTNHIKIEYDLDKMRMEKYYI